MSGNRSQNAAIAWHVNDAGGGTPAFDGATVYFIAQDHSVAALDATTGKTRWRTSTGSVGPSSGFTNCQVIGELVACGDSGIVAFRRSDGALAWRFDVSREQPGLFPFAVGRGAIFAGSFGRGTVYAVEGQTGVSLWTAPVLEADPSGVNIPSLTTDGDIVAAVFVRGTHPQTGGVVALDAASGSVRWLTNFSLAAPDSDSGGISVALWNASVVASSGDGRVYVLDRVTGATQFFFPGVGRKPLGSSGPVGPDLRRLAVSGSTLLTASLSGWIVAYDLVRHEELWRLSNPEGAANNSPIVVDDDKVYVNNINGRLAAFLVAEPLFLWHAGDFQNPFIASPAVGPDKIFVAGLTGFWAIDK